MGATITKDENSTWPEKNKTCQHCFQNVNVPASLLDRFAQTCTRPLPTLGQSVKHAVTCQHRFQNVNLPASLLDRFAQTCTSATRASQVQQVPRLPRQTQIDVSKCARLNEGGCHEVPRLPRQTQVDVSKCHACQVKRRWVSRSAPPATQSGAAPRATNGDQACHPSQPSATSGLQKPCQDGVGQSCV